MRAEYSATVRKMQRRCAAHTATREEGMGRGWAERGNRADYKEEETRDSAETRAYALRLADLPVGILRLVTYRADSLFSFCKILPRSSLGEADSP